MLASLLFFARSINRSIAQSLNRLLFFRFALRRCWDRNGALRVVFFMYFFGGAVWCE
jgi:hypothetical protein